jgi:hypothetical protein
LYFAYRYLGAWEQFTYRKDSRLSDKAYKRWRMHEYGKRKKGNVLSDDIRPWRISGFVQAGGEEEAARLLHRVGKLDPLPGEAVVAKGATTPSGEQYMSAQITHNRRISIQHPSQPVLSGTSEKNEQPEQLPKDESDDNSSLPAYYAYPLPLNDVWNPSLSRLRVDELDLHDVLHERCSCHQNGADVIVHGRTSRSVRPKTATGNTLKSGR